MAIVPKYVAGTVNMGNSFPLHLHTVGRDRDVEWVT